MTAQTPPRTRTASLLLTLGLACLLLLPAARADPLAGDGAGSIKTLTWALNDTDGLALASTAIENGAAVLSWVPESVNWSRGSDFTANGYLTAGLVPNSIGFELAADPRNHIENGNFSEPGPWELFPTENVSVFEEVALEDAYIGHTSPAPPQDLFASLDLVNDPRWNSTGSSGSGCLFIWVSPGRGGTGSMIRCTITLGPPGSFAGLEWPAANWSAWDRLLLWVHTVDQLSWSFRLGATVAGVEHLTTVQSLSLGWQEIVVDLNELGPDRAALAYIHFLIVGDSVSLKDVEFDDIRLAKAKSFEETARLRQTFAKPTVTTPASGSATLLFDYQIVDNSGVDAFDFAVNFSGDEGSFLRSIPIAGGSSSNRYSTDVSSVATAAGLYHLEFLARIRVDSIGISNAAVRIDNVSIEFPNRTSGSFLSRVMDFGVISGLSSILWSGAIPNETTAVLKVRSGNETNPDGLTWSGWRTWGALGTYSPDRGPSRYIQIGVDLSTMNASRTPVIDALELDVIQRALSGSIEASWEVDRSSFTRWTSMLVEATVPSGVGIQLFVKREGSWERVQSGELPLAASPAISWRVLLTTSHGLMTPRVSSVVLTYEVATFPGNLASILLHPYVLGLVSVFAAILGYSIFVVISRRAFAVDDLFLISREGRLMMHNTRRMRPDRDEDILSGMLTAILAFVKDSDPEGNGELHHFTIGDKTTVLEKGEHSYVAAVYSGRVPRWAAKDLKRFLKDLEARFGNVFAEWSGDPEDLRGLQEFTARFVSRIRYRPPNGASGRASWFTPGRRIGRRLHRTRKE